MLASFKLENSSINFEKDENYNIEISNINNHLTNLGNTVNEAKNILSFKIDNNSNISTNTIIKNSDFKDFEILSDIDLANIDLKKLSDYKKEFLANINIKSLVLGSKVNIDFKTKDQALIIKTKDTKISKINILKDKEIDFKAKELLVENSELNLKENRLKIGDINLNSSDISYVYFKTQNDNKTDKKDTNSKEDSTFAILTNEIKINNTKLNFEDKTLRVPFKVLVHDINGFVSSINTKKNLISDLKINGVINKYATSEINAKVNLNNLKIFSDIDFKIKNLSINDFTPYSREFIAQDIDEGKLDLNLKYNIENSNLNAKKNIIISKIKLGKTYEIKGVETLPLGIAIALLEDSNDVIKINLPISGNLDDPEFSIAPIVWKAFANLIFKAATAPFSLLGTIFNFGNDEINKISFEFNQINIGPIQKETLDKLIEILTNRPNMALEYGNVYNKELEKNQIIEEKYNNFIKMKNEKISLKDFLFANYLKMNKEEKAQKLLRDYEKKEDDLLKFLIKHTKENIIVSNEDYQKIALLRSKNIKEYLIKNGVSEKQIIVDEEFIEESLQKDSIIIEFKVNTL